MDRQMRYFIAVVETGSFFEAGEACHISQSAVSQQIRSLEQELGVALLSRRGRKFSVTPAGEYFYQQAKRQIQALDSLIREVRRIGTGEYQRLRVGVLHGFSPAVVHAAVRDFAATHPYVRLSLTTGTHEELFHPVSAGSLDMVINDQWRTLSDQYVNEPLMDQPLFALLRSGDPLSGRPRLTPEDLQDRLCILVSSPAQRENEVSHWRDVMGLQSSFLFVDNVDEARMNAGAGVGFYPCDGGMDSGGGTILVPLCRGDAPMTRRMFAFWPQGSDSSLQREFTDRLRRSIQQTA